MPLEPIRPMNALPGASDAQTPSAANPAEGNSAIRPAPLEKDAPPRREGVVSDPDARPPAAAG